MAKINELEAHDIKGKLLEKEGKIKDWGKYNKDLFKLTKEAAKEQGKIGKERRMREAEDLGADIVDQAWFESGKTQSFMLPDVSEIIGTRQYTEKYGNETYNDTDKPKVRMKKKPLNNKKCMLCDSFETRIFLSHGEELVLCTDHYLKHINTF